MTKHLNRRSFLMRTAGAAAIGALSPIISPEVGLATINAQTVANWVQRFYDQTSTLQASFYQTYYHRLYRRYQRSIGRLQVSKPGRIRFDYGRPNGKIIVSNGERLTIFQPGEPGEAGQYVTRPVGRAALPAAFSFLTGEGRLHDDYRLRLLSARRYRFNGRVLELRPRRADPNIRRVLLFVDHHPDRRGVVRRIRIDDHAGNRNKFEFRGFRFNRAIPGSTFAWRPPAGSHRMGS